MHVPACEPCIRAVLRYLITDLVRKARIPWALVASICHAAAVEEVLATTMPWPVTPSSKVICQCLSLPVLSPAWQASCSTHTPGTLAGLSVGQHLLLAYLKSLRAVMHVQFTKKGLRGGKSGVVRLAEESAIVQVALDLAHRPWDVQSVY